jgi:hypothetical protein
MDYLKYFSNYRSMQFRGYLVYRFMACGKRYLGGVFRAPNSHKWQNSNSERRFDTRRAAALNLL